MRPRVILALLCLVLAGCSGGSEDGGGQPTLSATTTTTEAPPPLPTSDTLHFLAAPEMSTILVGSESVTPVGTGRFGGGGGGGGQEQQGAEWRHVVETPTMVSAGEVRIWVDIKETLHDSPGTPLREQCTWSLTVALGADVPEIQLCKNEPAGPINAGIKELVFTLVVGSPVEMEANETIVVTLERSAFSLSANNAVDARSGTEQYDSRIKLAGLKEPIRNG